MSVEITITGLEQDFWEALVHAWVSEQEHPLGEASPDADGCVHLFVIGSIRGVLTWFEGEQGMVRLAHLASRADWAVARELVAAALEGGGGAALEGEALSAAELAGPAWGRRAKEQVQRDIQTIRAVIRQHGRVSLPADGWALPVGEADLQGEPVIVETRLATRAGRYAAAEPARALRLRGAEDERTVSVWPFVPTRMERVHDVVIELDEGFGLVPFAAVLDALGEEVERIGEDPEVFYLPHLAEDDPRRATLRAAATPLRAGQ